PHASRITPVRRCRTLGPYTTLFRSLLSSRTVADNVAMPLKLADELPRVQIKQRVVELLARVGLSEHANKYPAQLSGGQKQRVGRDRKSTRLNPSHASSSHAVFGFAQ